METRIVNFYVYRYHLLPIKSSGTQYNLFGENNLTIDQIREKKNEFFKLMIEDVLSKNNSHYPIQLTIQEGDYYMFKIAQKKITKITKDFKNIQIENEPYVHVIINNNPEVQKIAISDNLDAFSSQEVVKNILKKIFQKRLETYGLNIEIEQLFDSVNFWEYVGKHKDFITFIDFQFVKPNLAHISKSLPEVFKNFSDDVNSHESHITIKAPDRGTLENIDKTNKNIDGLVDYTSNGAGCIKLKVKNIRKRLNTKECPYVIQIDEVEIEGAAENVFKYYQQIVGE